LKIGAVEEYKRLVKTFLFELINNTLKSYLPRKRIPPLFLDFTSIEGDRIKFIIPEILEFLHRDRKVLDVKAGDRSFLLPVEGGFIIYVNKHLGHQKMLTELSHEIGHTYLYEAGCLIPMGLERPYISTVHEMWRKIEGLAYEIGREILLPRYAFIEYIKRRNFQVSTEDFLTMARELRVSKIVLAKRLIHDLKIWDVGVCWGEFVRDRISEQGVIVGPSLKRYKMSMRGLVHSIISVEKGRIYKYISSTDYRPIEGEIIVRGKRIRYELKVIPYRNNHQKTFLLCLVMPDVPDNKSMRGHPRPLLYYLSSCDK